MQQQGGVVAVKRGVDLDRPYIYIAWPHTKKEKHSGSGKVNSAVELACCVCRCEKKGEVEKKAKPQPLWLWRE